LLYGQVQKGYRRRRLVRIRYRMLCGTLAQLRTTLGAMGLSGRLTTAFIERLNRAGPSATASSAVARATWASTSTR
jgi:hypothetical protein